MNDIAVKRMTMVNSPIWVPLRANIFSIKAAVIVSIKKTMTDGDNNMRLLILSMSCQMFLANCKNASPIKVSEIIEKHEINKAWINAEKKRKWYKNRSINILADKKTTILTTTL